MTARTPERPEDLDAPGGGAQLLPVVALPSSPPLPGERRTVAIEDPLERRTALFCVEQGGGLGLGRCPAGWEECPVDALPIRPLVAAVALEDWRCDGDGTLRLAVRGERRVRCREVVRWRPVRIALVEPAAERVGDEARLRHALSSIDRLLALRLGVGRDPGAGLRAVGGPLAELVGRVAARFDLPDPLRDRLLECDDVAERIERLVDGLGRLR